MIPIDKGLSNKEYIEYQREMLKKFFSKAVDDYFNSLPKSTPPKDVTRGFLHSDSVFNKFRHIEESIYIVEDLDIKEEDIFKINIKAIEILDDHRFILECYQPGFEYDTDTYASYEIGELAHLNYEDACKAVQANRESLEENDE